jgi:hypothetical protein
MERVEGMMERLKLTAAEHKGIKIGQAGKVFRSSVADPQAVGKVMAGKLVNAEGLAHALGRIWCPIKGITCKDLGANIFLFTFHQK